MTHPLETPAPGLQAVDDGIDLRTLPHNIDAEMCVLGGMMLAPSVIDDIAALIAVGDFYRPAHSMIYDAIRDLHRRGEGADAVTVYAELCRRGQQSRTGEAEYLHALVHKVPTAANAVYYARIVRETSELRKLIAVGTQIVHRAYAAKDDAGGLVSWAQEELLREETAPADVPRLDEALDDAFEWLDTDPAEDTARIAAPYADLDRLLEGFQPGQLVIIGARPGIGKSVVALDIARAAALQQQAPVYFSSVEMRRQEVVLRAIAAEGRIPLNILRGRRLTEAHWDKVAAVRNRIANTPNLLIDDSEYVTVDTIRAGLRRMTHRSDVGAPRLLVVDYLQLLKLPGTSKKPENRQVEIAEISRNLKLLAREFEIPVIALSQLNRNPEARSDKRPAVSDLRESGAQEQDADVVILLHREDATDKESPRAGEMDIIVGKNRSGPTGTVAVAFQGHYARATDMAGGQ